MREREPLPPSLYADTACPAFPTPELDGDRRTSVAIVGGGFTGLSTALHLAAKGVDVTLLEAHEPGWGASGRNGGQVNPGLKHDPDVIEADLGPDLGRRMVALSWNAPNVLFDLVRSYQLQCEAQQSGTLRAAFEEAGARSIRASHEQGDRRQMPVELLGRDAVQSATGTDRYICALLDRRGGHVNPLSYARGLAKVAMEAGAKVHGGTRAVKLSRAGGYWSVETPTGTVTCEKLILATNGYTDELWPNLKRTIVPVYSGIIASEPIPEAVARNVFPMRGSLYEMGHVTVYYRLDAQNRLVIGGRCRQRPIRGPEQMAFLKRYALRLWPELAAFEFTHGWNGQIGMTLDHYPHIHEPADGVLVCLGYNGRGVAMSTTMGALLSERIMGGKAADIDMPITDMKSIPFHGLWRTGVEARIVYGRIRDFLQI